MEERGGSDQPTVVTGMCACCHFPPKIGHAGNGVRLHIHVDKKAFGDRLISDENEGKYFAQYFFSYLLD